MSKDPVQGGLDSHYTFPSVVALPPVWLRQMPLLPLNFPNRIPGDYGDLGDPLGILLYASIYFLISFSRACV